MPTTISVAQISLIVRWELSTSIFGRVMCVEGQTALVAYSCGIFSTTNTSRPFFMEDNF
jgi:hypothetical protein